MQNQSRAIAAHAYRTCHADDVVQKNVKCECVCITQIRLVHPERPDDTSAILDGAAIGLQFIDRCYLGTEANGDINANRTEFGLFNLWYTIRARAFEYVAVGLLHVSC